MPDKAKNLRKGASNIKLHAGGGIRFGFMRQNNLSGRTLSVTDVSSYIFDRDSFASYQLRDEDTDINMILAEGERPQDSYLALSLPLKDKWFSSLFSALPPRQWMQLKPEDKVSVSADSVLIPQGWLVKEYRHVLTTKGRKIEGDFRQSRHSELAEFYSDPFDYVLLVSEDGEYALELEKYENGTARIYATVYRPVSDISESTQFHRPYIVANNSAEAMLAKAEEAAPLEMPDIQADAPSESTITGLVQTSPVSVSNMLLREEVQEIAATALTTVKTATETQNFSGNMLACDVSLAANLIEEARRNKISMADVIRKVIDLPRKIDDRVYLPFDLTEEEHIALAKRYGLSESNTEAVQKKIVEELRQFAGLE